jgi:hypothetical protein
MLLLFPEDLNEISIQTKQRRCYSSLSKEFFYDRFTPQSTHTAGKACTLVEEKESGYQGALGFHCGQPTTEIINF